MTDPPLPPLLPGLALEPGTRLAITVVVEDGFDDAAVAPDAAGEAPTTSRRRAPLYATLLAQPIAAAPLVGTTAAALTAITAGRAVTVLRLVLYATAI